MKTQELFYRLYLGAYRLVYLLVVHAGPLQTIMIHLGGPVQRLLFPRSYYAPNPVRVDGLWYHNDNALDARTLSIGMYEPDTTHLIQDILKPGMTMLDVGANFGYFSMLAARLVGERGAVWAFEPVPSLIEVLNSNVNDNGFGGRIHVVPQAISNVVGRVSMSVDTAKSARSSLYAESITSQPGDVSVEQVGIKVASTTLDEWAVQHNWPPVDLIKMDIEGAEKLALDGMVKLSHRNAGLRLIVEFNLRTLNAAGVTAEGFFEALYACGFHRFFMIDRRLNRLTVPTDIPMLLRKVRNGNGESVNLLCDKHSS